MTKQLFTINEAAKLLGVSIKTLRRWDQKGLLSAQRTIGNQRRYALEDLEVLKGKKVKSVIRKKQTERARQVTIAEAATFLGISVKTLRRWEAKGIIASHRSPTNQRFFLTNELSKLKDTKTETKGAEPVPQQPVNKTPVTFFNPTHSYAEKHMRFAGAFFSLLGILLTVTAFGASMSLPSLTGPMTKLLSLVPQMTTHDKKARSGNEVLATETQKHDYTLKVSVPAEFLSTASVSGKLTAPNILYSVVAGDNITISGDAQNPTISAHVDNLEALGMTAGDGIALSGTTISNTDRGSSQKIFGSIKVGSDTISAGNNTDTFELAAGDNVTLTTDTSNKKITISADSSSSSSPSTTISVKENDTLLSNAISTLDFLGGDFDVGESPTGEANIQLASILTSVTGVAGNFDVGNDLTIGGNLNLSGPSGSITIGSDTINDITGVGLAVSGSTLQVNLTTLGGSGSSSSNSGLEVGTNGLSLLKGCADGEILKWDDINAVWHCSADSGASTSGISTVKSNDVVVGSAFDTIDFSSLFSISASPSNEANIGIAANALNFSELSDALSLDAATTITNGLAGNLTIDLTSTGDFVIADAGTPFFTFTDGGALTQSGAGQVTFSGNVDATNGLDVTGTSLTVGGTNATIDTAGVITGTQINADNLRLDGNTLSSTANDIILDSLSGTVRLADLTTDGVVYTSGSNGTLNSEPMLSLSRGGTGLNITGSAVTDGQLLIGNDSANGFSLASLTAGAGITITNGSGTITIAQNGSGSSKFTQSDSLGVLYPNISTLDFLVGGTSTASAKFAILNVAGGTPAASVAGSLGATYITANGTLQTTNNQSLTLGGTATGNIILSPRNGSGDVRINGTTTLNGITYTWPASQGSNYVLQTDGNGTLSWINPGSLPTNNAWDTLSGVITPKIETQDLLLGSSATSSAKFAFINVLTGTPTASISGSGNNALALAGDGTIQTTNKQSLTLGGGGTGNIVLSGFGGGVLHTNASGVISTSPVSLTADVSGILPVANGGTGTNTFGGTNTILYTTSTDTLASIATGNNGVLITSAGGVPSISSTLPNAVQDNISRLGTISLGVWNGTSVGATYGGTGDNTSATTGVPYISSGDWQYEAQLATSRGGTGADLSAAAQYSIPYFSATGVLGGALAPSTAGYVLSTNSTGAAPSWIPASSIASNYWDQINGVLTPKIEILDLLLGDTATAGAKIAFTNVNSGTPTASLSAGLAGGLYLTADGKLQTTAYQDLAIGGTSTGNISLSGKGGSGSLALNFSGLTINGATGATSASPTCVSVTNGIVTGLGSCGTGSGGSVWTFNTTDGDLYPMNSTMDLLVGGVSTASAKFAVLNVAGGTPTASVSGSNGAAYLTANGELQTTNKQSLALGGGNTGDINLSIGAGNNLRINGTTGATVGAATCVTALNGIVTGTGSCDTPLSSFIWSTNSGAIIEGNTTQDLLIGSIATSSAQFAITGIAAGTPTASLAATTNNGGLSLNASNSTIQSLNKSSLILGGNTTGNIVLSGFATGILHSTNGVLSSSDVLLGTETSGNYVATITGNSQISVTGSGSENAGVSLAISNDSIGDAQLAFNTGQNLTTSSTPQFAGLTVNSDTITDFTGTGLQMNSGSLETTLGVDIALNSSETTGILPTSKGGTGADLTAAAQYSIPYFSATGVLGGALAPSTAGYVLATNSTGAAPSWVSATSLGSNYWDQLSGILTPKIETQDLLLGSQATASAKFAFTNVLTGTPTASISAVSTNNALSLDAAGNIFTTNKQTLTLGGTSTGNIVLADNTTIAGTLSQTGAGQVSFSGNLDATNGLDVTGASLTVGGSAASISTLGVISGSQLIIDNLRLDGNTLDTTSGNLILDSASGSTLISDLTTNGVVYTSGGNGTLNSEAQLSVARGGTGTNSSPTSGQLLIGTSGGGYSVASLTPGAGISISNGSGSITISQTTSATSKWTQDDTLGVLYPNISTLDLLVGGTSSSSAKFAILNVAGTNTPIASVSAGTPGAAYIAANGTLQTTNNQTLTVGGNTTGNLTFSPLNGNGFSTFNGKLGLNTTNLLATLDVRGSNSTQPAASIAANSNAFAGLVVDNRGNGDIFTASASGGTKFTITNAGNLILPNYAGNNSVLYVNPTTGVLTSLTTAGVNQCLVSGSTTPSWTSCAAAGSNWDIISGVITPKLTSTLDFLLGSQATASAKFAVLNINGSSTPFASLSATIASGGNGLGLSFGGDGSIQSLRNGTLTLGGATTGNLAFLPQNGNGFVTTTGRLGVNTTGTPLAALDIRNINSISPAASVSANSNSFAGLVVDNRGNGDIFTASSSGLTRFVIGQTGNLQFAGNTNFLTTLTSAATAAQTITIPNTGGAGGTICLQGSGACGFMVGTNYWQSANPGTITPYITTVDTLFGGVSTASATLRIAGSINSATNPAASISANTNFAGLVVDNKGAGDLFTASSSGLTRFTIAQNGTITAQNYAGSNAVLYAGTGTGTFATATTGSSNLCLISGASAPSWATCPGGSGGANWTLDAATGTIYPINATVDLLVGGTSSSSARFHVFGTAGLAGTQPVASVSGNTAAAGLIVDNRVGDLFTASSSGLTRFVINNNGNVGIGTALPSTNLEIASAQTTTYIKFNPTTNEDWRIGADGFGLSFINDSDGATRVTFDENGNVGIGTTDPTLGTFSRGLEIADSGTGPALALNATNGKKFIIGSADSPAGLYFRDDTAGIYRMAIDTNGSIGINTGTSNVLGTLDVRNNIGTKPTASVSGRTSFAGLLVDNSLGDLFTASNSGFTRFTIGQNGAIQSTAQGQNSNATTNQFDAYNTNTVGIRTGTMFRTFASASATSNVSLFATYSNLEYQASATDYTGDLAGTLSQVNWRGSGDSLTGRLIGSIGKVVSYSGSGAIENAIGLAAAGGFDGDTVTNYYGTRIYNPTGTATVTNAYGLYIENINKGATLNYPLYVAGGTSYFGGKIGVGATSPLATLDIRGLSGTTPVASFSGITSSATVVVDNSGVGDIFTASSSGLPRFVIRNNGNIGVGTTLPSAMLHIVQAATDNGALRIDSRTDGFQSYAFDIRSPENTTAVGYSGEGRNLNIFGGTSFYQTPALFVQGRDGAVISTMLGSTTTNMFKGTATVASIAAQTSFSTLVVDNGIGDIFTASSSGLPRFTIKQNGIVEVANTSTQNGLLISRAGTSNTLSMFVNNSNFPMIQSNNTSLLFNYGNGQTVQFGGPGSLGGAELNLAAYGKVGINSSTSYLGSLDVRPNVTNGGTISVASVSGATSFAGLVVDNSGVGDIFTASSSGLPRFVIKNGGQVGIGTTNPLTALDIVGSASMSGSLSLRGQDTAHTVNILQGGSLGFYYSAGGDTGVGVTPAIMINRNGNVGINAANPAYRLDVGGFANATSYFTVGASASGPSYSFGSDTASGMFLPSSGILGFSTSGTEKLRIDSTGKFGFNTTSPLATLDVRNVSGTIAAASVSGRTSFAGLVVDNSLGDIFTASSSGLPRFTINQNGHVAIGTPSALATLQLDANDTFNPYPAMAYGSVALGDMLNSTSRATGIAMANSNGGSNVGFIGFNSDRLFFGAFSSAISSNNVKMTIDTTTNQLGLNVSSNIRGTLDVRGSTLGNGGTLSIASFSGTTSFAGLVVDNNSSTGDLFTASRSGQTKFTVGFDRVQIGTGSATGAGGAETPQLLGLDSKGSTGDPSNGRQGDMYYNTVDEKFRCYQGTGWTDCIAASAAEYLRAERQGPQQSPEVSQTDHINFNVATGSGSTIFLDTSAYSKSGSTSTGGRFTLAGGRTYKLSAHNSVVTFADNTSFAIFSWYNVTTGQILGSSNFQEGTARVANDVGGSTAEAIITTTSSTVVELRITSLSGTLTSVSSSNTQAFSSAFIQVLSGAQSVSASEYLRAELTSTQNTNLTDSDHIKFNTVAAFSGSSISLSTGSYPSLGRFTLKAGKTYRLSAAMPYVSVGQYGYIKWYNVTTSAAIGSPGLYMTTSYASAGSETSDGLTTAIITPSVDTVIEVRFENGASGFTSINGARPAWAHIEVISDGTKVAQFTGATSSADGAIGYVPAPVAGQEGSLLLGNGTWTDPTNVKIGTTLTEPIASLSARTSFAALVVNNNGSGDLFTASSSGLNRFVINNNGQIGIGTAGLATEGHVNIVDTLDAATAGTNNVSIMLRRNVATNGTGPGIGFSSTTATGIMGAKIAFLRTGSNSQGDLAFYLKGDVGSSGDTTTQALRLSAVGTSPIATFSGKTSFAGLVVDNSGSGDLFTASSSGLPRFTIKQNGNVGIGTDNLSSYKLRIDMANTNGNGILFERNDGSYTNSQIDLSLSSNGGNDGLRIQTSSNNGASFIDTLFTDVTGKVGIGTTNPLGTLDVRGNPTNGGTIPIASLSAKTSFAGLVVDNSGSGDLFTASSSGLNRFVIKQNGNVGIGTNLPNSPLYVTAPGDFGSGGAGNQLALFKSSTTGNTGATISLQGDAATFDIVKYTSGASPANQVVLNQRDNAPMLFQTNNTGRMMIDGSGNVSVRNGAFCVDNDGTDCPVGPTAGRIYAANTTLILDDVAELMRSSEDLEPGDVVMPDPDFVNQEEHTYEQIRRSAELGTNKAIDELGVKKTTQAYQKEMVGVVSTRPGITLGGFEPTAQDHEIALTGRIPVKVSTQNGAIHTGDLLTSSSIPGAAMKATKAGFVIGRALEDYTNTDPTAIGKVMLYLNVTWQDPDVYLTDTGNISTFDKGNSTYGVTMPDGSEVNRTGVFSDAVIANLKTGSLDAQSLSLGGINLNDKLLGLESGMASSSAGFGGSLASLQTQVLSLSDRVASLEASLATLTASNSALFMNNPLGNFTASSTAELSLDKLNVNGSIVSDSLNVLGYTTMNELSVTGSIRTGLLTIKGQSNGGASISTLNGDLRLQDQGLGGIDILNGLVTIDTSGNIQTEGTITAKKLNIDETDTLSASVGQGTIPLNATNAIINTTAVTSDSHIFVTPRTKTALPLSVTTQTAGSSFKVEITSPATQPVKFDWFIVN